MIFLFHEEPGVAKTYTAESIAQEINPPLITLTSANVGIDLDKLDERLEHWFKLGKRWGAILLIDEADDYLEQFDKALLSRVDVQIYYKDFTHEQRVGLWSTFFRRLHDERENEMPVHRSARDYVTEDKTLLALKWGVRDIRNVKDEHTQQAVEMAKDFSDYLGELYQKTSEERSLAKRLRADHVGVQESNAKSR